MRVARRARFPRSHSPGRLLGLVASDMPGHTLQHVGAEARLVAADGGAAIVVSEKVERRFLGRTEVARFHVSAAAPPGGPGLVRVRHTGRVRRQGIEAVMVKGDQVESRLASALGSDTRFGAALLPLDFTVFEVTRSEGRWLGTVELMGASYVSIALPPMRSYVRLHRDQAEALVGALSALSAVLGDHGVTADG